MRFAGALLLFDLCANTRTQAQICTARADLAPDPSSCSDLDADNKPDMFDNPLFRGGNGTRVRIPPSPLNIDAS
jgi:hypothetical protein